MIFIIILLSAVVLGPRRTIVRLLLGVVCLLTIVRQAAYNRRAF